MEIIIFLVVVVALRVFISSVLNPKQHKPKYVTKDGKPLGRKEEAYMDALLALSKFTQQPEVAPVYQFVVMMSKGIVERGLDIQNNSAHAAFIGNEMIDAFAEMSDQEAGTLAANVGMYVQYNWAVQDAEIALGIEHNPQLIQDSATGEVIFNAFKAFINGQRLAA